MCAIARDGGRLHPEELWAGMDSRVGAVGAGGAVGFSPKAKLDYIDAMSRVTSYDVDAGPRTKETAPLLPILSRGSRSGGTPLAGPLKTETVF